MILVTGALGFIAQHIVKLLVQKEYKVVGTVRLAAKGDKMAANLGPNFQYVLVEDMTLPGAFDAVFEQFPFKVAIHTASPFFYESSDVEKDLIEPAVNGTKSFISAVKKSSVEHVVFTLSDAALYSATDEQNPNLKFDETSWNNISLEEAKKDPVSAYYGGKAFAEKLIWALPRVTTVNPVYVFGPQAFDNEVSARLNTSNEVINGLLKAGSEGTFENEKGGFVDVRDVAKAHVLAFERRLTGRRLFMTNGNFCTQMMADVLLKHGYKVPRGAGDYKMELAMSSNKATRDLLGIDLVPFDATVLDTALQIIRQGYNLHAAPR